MKIAAMRIYNRVYEGLRAYAHVKHGCSEHVTSVVGLDLKLIVDLNCLETENHSVQQLNLATMNLVQIDGDDLTHALFDVLDARVNKSYGN